VYVYVCVYVCVCVYVYVCVCVCVCVCVYVYVYVYVCVCVWPACSGCGAARKGVSPSWFEAGTGLAPAPPTRRDGPGVVDAESVCRRASISTAEACAPIGR
ncbi:hypothetical protein PI86_07110, partial [Burkholderia sp. A9]|uniref:hypothetical protein n=1 Tax=Burkholderia sp. A9 TaxID=1365108 RepID=UPI000575310D